MERKRTTDNGIDIYWYPNKHTHSFCLSLYSRTGVLYEEETESGITHFLEHVLFRNIQHLMGGQMYREIDRLGLYFNGATYKEFMQLYIIGSPRYFRQAADILLRAFAPLVLPGSVLETEKQRVKSEIREADEFKSLDYFAGTFVWKGTPLSRSILGSRGAVSRFSRQKTADYHRKSFSAENVFFYVTGNVSDAEIDDLARKIEALPQAGSAAPDGRCLKRRNIAPVPEDFGRRGAQIHVKNSRSHVVQFSYDLNCEQYQGAELALLYDILFSGENSLLHQELSEKRGLIYSFSPALEKYSNIGRLCFTYEVSSRDFVPSIRIVEESLRLVGRNMDERLSLVLPEYTDNAYMVYDDNEAFNWQRAYESHIMADPSRSIEESREAFRRVSAARLSRMAEEIFRPENLVLSVKGDKRKIDEEELRRICCAGHPRADLSGGA